jgi:phage-related protein
MSTSLVFIVNSLYADIPLTRLETPVLRPLVWMGSAKRDLQAFPTGAQKMSGDQLQLIQFGGMPKDATPFHGVGSGILEIAISYATDALRTVVAVPLGSAIFVLHAFQTKSKTGKKTPRQDVDLIKKRYKEAQELAKHANEEKDHCD